MKKLLLTTLFSVSALTATAAQAATYDVDNEGAHASVNFQIQHLGYSWLTGRFNDFDGSFEYDAAAPEKSSIEVANSKLFKESSRGLKTFPTRIY